MAAPHVLLLGGHGRVSLLMTPKLLARSWNVTSIIRDSSQTAEIQSLGQGKPGKITVLVRSLDNIKSDEDAKKILDEVRPDWVVWSAGAGGKGGVSRTYAIDQDASQHFASAALASSSIRKYLLVSALLARKTRASWWQDEDWASVRRANDVILVDYGKAKIAADHYFARQTAKRVQYDTDFQGIILRPGTLSDDEEVGRVSLGKTKTLGKISRGDVAEVATQLLARDDTRGWYDLQEGQESIQNAIAKCVQDGIDSAEGEDIG